MKRKTVKPTKPKRYYSPTTLKELFTLSYNQCAHPDCTNPIIEPATPRSNALVSAQICHIYAIGQGPRGSAGLSEKELNAPENLILLCRHHHGIVDGQPETYPAEMLRGWKQSHELEMHRRVSIDKLSVQRDAFSVPVFPLELIDQKIREQIDTLRKARFYHEFDKIAFAELLAQRVAQGELSLGSAPVRGFALAWCARILARSDKSDRAEDYLAVARNLATSQENDIVGAFLTSQKGDKVRALKTLADIDSAAARSAALMVVGHHDGPEKAGVWLAETGIDCSTLDADGKYYLWLEQLRVAKWAEAAVVTDIVSEEDMEATPILHRAVAVSRLLSVVPDEIKGLVSNGVPFEAAHIPLGSSDDDLAARRYAESHFEKGAAAARTLRCPLSAALEERFALWLRLRDPERSMEGKRFLEAELRSVGGSLALVPLALQFGVQLDLAAVEERIDQQVALRGEITHDAALARLALALTQKSPAEIAAYVELHYDQLLKCTDPKYLLFLRIEALARAGFIDKAKSILSELLEQRIAPAEEGRLRRIISEAEGADPSEVREKQFEVTGALPDLVSLVEMLESRKDWTRLCKYGGELFQRTRDVPDAERLAGALTNAGRSDEVVRFSEANADLRSRSPVLRLMYAWALYEEGQLVEARAEHASLTDRQNDENYRRLQLNLAIALGDWSAISAFVASEYADREKRSGLDLLRAAQLAFYVGSPDAKALTFSAAQKGADDANVLATAYFLASNAGWENDADVANWVQNAAELSGDAGPMQKMTLREVLDRKPDWDRRESEVLGMLSRGETPLFLAAQSLNKSLIEVMLFPSLLNEGESDPRRRALIPVRSGKKPPAVLDCSKKIGLDSTALLTLSFLGLLEQTIAAFAAIRIPHSTLGWVFREKQRAGFHQPSRVVGARRVRELLARDVLHKFVAQAVVDSDLAAEVGDELASLIAEAERRKEGDERQRIVIQPSPVHRIGSLMEEEADLSAHAAVLSSCQALVDKLRGAGRLTAEEDRNARAYLRFHEKPWPAQPEIKDRAILYLDGLAMTYFLHLGLLEKLSGAGFIVVASSTYVSEADSLIAYDRISTQIQDLVGGLRTSLNSGIEQRKITVGRRRSDSDQEERSLFHPTVGVFSLGDQCDAIVVDDRFLNEHQHLDHKGVRKPLFSTLDIIDALVSSGTITSATRLDLRTRLRRAGHVFIPVDDEELSSHLMASGFKARSFVETVELRAIRESVLLVRMHDWIQLPKEGFWLDSTIKTFIRVLKSLWLAGADTEAARVRSNWIVEQIDVRGWAHRHPPEVGDGIVNIGRGFPVSVLIMPPIDVPQEIQDAYSMWAEEAILAPIKEAFPELYAHLVDWQRKRIAETADFDLKTLEHV